MPAFSVLTDSMICLIAYVCAAGFTLRWVHRSNQDRVQKTADVTRSILVRLAVIVGGLFVACWLIDIAAWIPLLALGILLMFGLTGGLLGLPVAAVFWMIQQYILGFPDRDELILAPPGPIAREHSESAALTQLIGHDATVLSPLKPTGEIDVCEARHTATSESGGYLDPGDVVVVTGVKDGRLLVRQRSDTCRESPWK
jgi:hypothetical protein